MFFLFMLVGFLGACLGSFASVLSTRMPKGQKWYGLERSACPSCGETLLARDLVPIFSWLVLNGRCRTCKISIPVFYPLLEIICAGLAMLGAWILGFGLALILWLGALPFIVAFALIGFMSIKTR